MNHRIEIDIRPSFLFYLAGILLVLPLPWVVGALLAAFLHETAHYLATRLLGVPILSITVLVGGARIKTGAMIPFQELIVAAVGPAAGCVLLLAFPIFPQLAVCGLAQSLFNLLPLFPLDGGRILRAALKMLFGAENNCKVCKAVEWTIYAFLTILTLRYLRFGVLFFLLFAVMLAGKPIKWIIGKLRWKSTGLDKKISSGKL